MSAAGDVSNLGIHDTEDLAAWFLYHMPGEQRGRLIAERPKIYAKLCPTVTPERIAEIVREHIEADRAAAAPPRPAEHHVTSATDSDRAGCD